MNHQSTPHQNYLALFQQQPIKPRGSFWKAFYLLQKHGVKSARAVLSHDTFDSNGHPKASKRIQLLQALACRNFIDIADLDWLQMLALSGCSLCLHQLLETGRITAIHAVHVEIELGRNRIANPHLKASDADMTDLLHLYTIEEELLSESAHSNHRLKEWFRQRRSRAMSYFEIYEGGGTASTPAHSGSSPQAGSV